MTAVLILVALTGQAILPATCIGWGGRPVLDLLNGSTLELAEQPKTLPSGIVEITGVARVQSKSADRLTITAVK